MMFLVEVPVWLLIVMPVSAFVFGFAVSGFCVAASDHREFFKDRDN
jgi:hypothetical protein